MNTQLFFSPSGIYVLKIIWYFNVDFRIIIHTSVVWFFIRSNYNFMFVSYVVFDGESADACTACRTVIILHTTAVCFSVVLVLSVRLVRI